MDLIVVTLLTSNLVIIIIDNCVIVDFNFNQNIMMTDLDHIIINNVLMISNANQMIINLLLSIIKINYAITNYLQTHYYIATTNPKNLITQTKLAIIVSNINYYNRLNIITIIANFIN